MRAHQVVWEGSGIELLDQKGATDVAQLGGFDGRELGMQRDHRYPDTCLEIVYDRHQQGVDLPRQLDGRAVRANQSSRLPDLARRCVQEAFDRGKLGPTDRAGSYLKDLT